MNTTHKGQNFTAFGHGTHSKNIDLNHREKNTRLYCFFSKNEHDNNISSSSGDNSAIRNGNIANKKGSTLKKQEKSPKRTIMTAIKIINEDEPLSNASNKKSIAQRKSTLTITEKISAAITKFLFKQKH